jgi:hypothetical protein
LARPREKRLLLAAFRDGKHPLKALIESLDLAKRFVVGSFWSRPFASNHVPQFWQKILVGTISALHDQH